KKAEELSERIYIRPYNGPQEPNEDEPIFVDSDLVRWTLRPVSIPGSGDSVTRNYVEVTCLDDSAIKKRIGVENEFTYIEFVDAWGKSAKMQFVGLVNQEYLDLKDVESHSLLGGKSLHNPLETIVNSDEVTISSKQLPFRSTILFSAFSVDTDSGTYGIQSGIFRGKAFAACKPGNKKIESVVVSSIENHPEFSLDVLAIKSQIKNLEI
ncbi:MAG: hypothetical protein KAS73_02150, partial [Candidatus Sabulitectum sp.]|nr:hypothetical protein [Candidatus Sabulitectum sp.]